MPETLGIQDRERLIQIVYLLRRDMLEKTPAATLAQTMRMVAPVLAHLKRRSLAETIHLLGYPHASSASQPHWAAMRGQVQPVLSEIASTYPDETLQKAAALFTLGWLNRLGRIVAAEEDDRFSGRYGREASSERLRRDQPSESYRREERSGRAQRDHAARIELPPDEPLRYNPLEEALSRLKQDEAGPTETEAVAPESVETHSIVGETTEEAMERPTAGKHLLWVTAFPGSKPRILTEWGERVSCSSLLNFNIPDSAKYIQEDGSEGLMCLAEVTYKNGAAISARFLHWLTEADYEV